MIEAHQPGKELGWATQSPSRPTPPTPIPPCHLDRRLPLLSEGTGPEEGGKGRLQGQQRQDPAGRVLVGVGGALPCPGHDVVLLGLLVMRLPILPFFRSPSGASSPLLLLYQGNMGKKLCPASRATLPYHSGQPGLASMVKLLGFSKN